MADEIAPEQLAEQIRKLRIEDVLLSTVTTLGQLAYTKLDSNELDQARLAIDSIAALLDPLEQGLGPDARRDFNQLLANVRLAYADRAARVSGSEPQSRAREAEAAAKPQSSEPERDADVTEPSREGLSGSEPQSPDDEPA